MWLPKYLYEPLPIVLIVAGAGLIGAVIAIEDWHLAEMAGAGGLLLVIVGFVLVLRRKGYRASRSRIDFTDSE